LVKFVFWAQGGVLYGKKEQVHQEKHKNDIPRPIVRKQTKKGLVTNCELLMMMMNL
jgi:hypothetical protein